MSARPAGVIAMLSADILAALEKHAAEDTSRGDEQYAHVSDLPFCLRKTWYRRNGHTPEPFDAETRRKFKFGDIIEDYTADAIAAQMPHARRHVRMAIAVVDGEALDDGHCLSIESREITETEVPDEDEIIGHLDIDLPDRVIEVKSTQFYRGKSPARDEVKPHYKIQASTYALARGKPYNLTIIDRATCQAVSYDYDQYELESEVIERMDDVILLTRPGAPMPPAEPVIGWECGYCPFKECERWKDRRT